MFAEAEADPSLSKEAFKPIEARLRVALLNAQYQRLQKAEKSLLVVVAGIDGAGKGATVNLLNEWMDPRHIKTLAYGPPEGEELERPWLWRYWKDLPAKGSTGIVFGSWYAQLLRETSRKRPNQDTIEALSAAIRRFEAMLTAEGCRSSNCGSTCPPTRKGARRALLSSPETSWQVAPADLKVFKKYNRLRNGGQIVINHTDCGHAPWVVIPSADEQMRAARTAEPCWPPCASAACRASRPASWRIRGLRASSTGSASSTTRPASTARTTSPNSACCRAGWPAPRVRRNSRTARWCWCSNQDAAGKGGAIRRVTHALDARQFDITPVAAPNSYELSRPYLWRFWRQLPRRGRIAIFDRSWYGRVLVERVEAGPPADWRRAYAEINDFEEQLSGSGALVLKFWLAVTPDVQLERFKEREKSPFKNFKITPDDWRNRDKWKEYAAATNEMLTRTDVAHAPWHLVSANDKRYARLQVLRHIVEALENPR